MSFFLIVKLVIVISVVLSAMALAMRASAEQMLYLLSRPAVALRAAISLYVVVPVIASLAILLVDPRPGVALALLVLSLAPVPPLLPKKQLKSGGDGAYILGLLVFAALASLLLMPLGLPLLTSLFGHNLQVPTAPIAKTLAITVAGPMLLGLIAQKALGPRADRVAYLIAKAGFVLLVVGSVLAVAMLAPALWRLIGGGTLLVMLLVIVAALAAGYLLGGPTRSTRTALALASATRHPGVAIGVIGSSLPEAKLAALAVLIYVLLNVVVGIPFVMAARRRAGR
ncbi:hypothetical protein [Pseudoxanthomonas indica]|uniref:Bile acid:Na+ symporter, BASS family n=1 Tax=Pseudoxanthomonas indica TaxID=428993 RepID=A0A1T5LCQ4_9GAMM|nr:hypothetical protein [Pseudoxanthomonas indica]GGD33668.1 hypothetical protein GCM10007235_01940 [Pseudoxanthomonas indica]SKC73816.1 bile acid:Na+ symporter, BASS family [Pseudoxanthomonas indica]